MPTIIIAVNNDNDIAEGRFVPFDLSCSRAKLVFMDVETESTVQILYWNEESGCSIFPDRPVLF